MEVKSNDVPLYKWFIISQDYVNLGF